MCPFTALKEIMHNYLVDVDVSLFQYKNMHQFVPMTDLHVRKTIKAFNVKFGVYPHFHTFHGLTLSGITFAKNFFIPIQEIKCHGTWSSICVWTYIQWDHTSFESLAAAFAKVVNA